MCAPSGVGLGLGGVEAGAHLGLEFAAPDVPGSGRGGTLNSML